MTKGSYMETYIKNKAEKNEIVDYDVLNKGFKQCEFCKRYFHPKWITQA